MSFNYHSDLDYQTSNFMPTQAEKPVTTDSSTSATMPSTATEKPAGALNIDRDHHVPLVATALMDGSGGIAVDHRIPDTHNFGDHEYDPTQFFHIHEWAEVPHMHNLMEGGMSAQDAYHDAHDKIAIPTETAAVKAYAVRNNLDPEAFMDNFKQFTRGAVATAREPTDVPRHPYGHTTIHDLDTAELGLGQMQKYAMHVEPGTAQDVMTEYSGQDLSRGIPAAGPGKASPIVRLENREDSDSRYKSYKVLKDGEYVGNLSLTDYGDGHYHLNGAYGRGGNSSNDLGPTTVRSAFREFIKENPDAKSITTFRVSGARRDARGPANITFDVKDGNLVLNKKGFSYAEPEDRAPRQNSSDILDRALRNPSYRQLDQPSLDETMREIEANVGEGKAEPWSPPRQPTPWQDQPLRNPRGGFISPDGPLAETGPAQFRNAMGSLGLRPTEYNRVTQQMRENYPTTFLHHPSNSNTIAAGAAAGSMIPSDTLNADEGSGKGDKLKP